MSHKVHEQGYSYILIDDKPLEDARSPFWWTELLRQR